MNCQFSKFMEIMQYVRNTIIHVTCFVFYMAMEMEMFQGGTCVWGAVCPFPLPKWGRESLVVL